MPTKPNALVPSPSTSLVVGEIRRPAFEQAALAIIAAKRSPCTQKAYKADLERWLRYCYASYVTPEAPMLNAATAFRDVLLAEISSVSAHRVVSALSSIYRALLRAGVVRSNPFHPEALAWPEGQSANKTPTVSDLTAEAMIANADGDPDRLRGFRDAAILRLLYDTGLRRSSVAAIARVDVQDATLRTYIKGGRVGDVGLPIKTHAVVERWLALAPASPYLFPGERGGHIHVETINKIVSARAKAVGADGVHPHCFRATFITTGYDAVEAGKLAERSLQAGVHHVKVDMTRGYDRHDRGLLTAEIVAAFRENKRGGNG